MREEKRTGKFFEGYEPRFDFKGAGKDREQKVAEAYHKWLEKNPFSTEYTISINDFEWILTEIDLFKRKIHNLRRKLTGCEERNRILSKERD